MSTYAEDKAARAEKFARDFPELAASGLIPSFEEAADAAAKNIQERKAAAAASLSDDTDASSASDERDIPVEDYEEPAELAPTAEAVVELAGDGFDHDLNAEDPEYREVVNPALQHSPGEVAEENQKTQEEIDELERERASLVAALGSSQGSSLIQRGKQSGSEKRLAEIEQEITELGRKKRAAAGSAFDNMIRAEYVGNATAFYRAKEEYNQSVVDFSSVLEHSSQYQSFLARIREVANETGLSVNEVMQAVGGAASTAAATKLGNRLPELQSSLKDVMSSPQLATALGNLEAKADHLQSTFEPLHKSLSSLEGAEVSMGEQDKIALNEAIKKQLELLSPMPEDTDMLSPEKSERFKESLAQMMEKMEAVAQRISAAVGRVFGR